jgi:hypothetical protein
MAEPIAPLIAFLEEHLGTMAGGSLFEASPGQKVQVARFEDQPVPHSITYVTTGLSKHLLHQASGRSVRLELLTCIWSRFRDSGIDSLLFALSQDILERHHAPMRGEVVGPAGPVVLGSTLEAFYFLPPLYHPEALETFGPEDSQTVFVWALPVSASEATFIRGTGWNVFEKRIHSADPDLMDLARTPIV